MEIKPVILMNGDDSTRRGAEMVRDILFSDYKFLDFDTGVDARINSNDECIQAAADALAEYGAGIKISTASNDPRIKEKGWKSANIVLRPLAGVVGMFRKTNGKGGYKKDVAVMRYGSGDFYSETSCIPNKNKEGLETRIITQEFIIEDFYPFANAMVERAKLYNMQMILSSKWTISEGETYIIDICRKVFSEAGLEEGNRGEGDFYTEIADMAGAYIPINVSPPNKSCPMAYGNGGWMLGCGNANGDTFADITDLQHGNNTMGSECILRNGGSYYELPGGTAPGRADSDFKGNKFFSPIATLIAFNGGVVSVNPQAKVYCDRVIDEAFTYLENTPEEERCTQTMLEHIAKQASI